MVLQFNEGNRFLVARLHCAIKNLIPYFTATP
jgi:hypothetical protein